MPSLPEISALPSRRFEPRIYGVGAWTDNLHFAYDLVATVRPRILVELGTDRGESYFAFCQAVAEHKTGTRCFAVDTWQGDAQAGSYDETTFAEVSAHQRAHYAEFSTLLRSSFDDAAANFPPASIDILHLDGLHTEDAVRHDLETWLPKLAPGGVLLVHDVSVRTRDFGAWRVWEELQTRGRSYTFAEGPGLGVWQQPPARALTSPIESLLGPSAEAAREILTYYRTRANEVQARILRDWQDGTIRHTAAGRQTIVQIFHTHDGSHREEDSVVARVGHGEWKEISIPLPEGAGAAPLRIDFLSPYTTIDFAKIEVVAGPKTLFLGENPESFAQIAVLGDAARSEHAPTLRVQVTGPDPQLHLPSLAVSSDQPNLAVRLRLRVTESALPRA